ncbi:MAG: phage terminase large subunit [Rickettsiales bacterium]|jgi:hypothetical protein|nr:phage terminase large subunit [Rickettsiales bacterium]
MPSAAADSSFVSFLGGWNSLMGLSTPAHHVRIARWLERVFKSRKRRGLLLAFRASGKSTIVGLFIGWLLREDPNLRILVVAADSVLAKKMVRSARRIIEMHPGLAVIRPVRRVEWAGGCFTVERGMPLRDPSVLAMGIGANITGSRADVIVCDDVEVPKNTSTAARRAELREKLLELDFVLTPDGMEVFIGTPHVKDTIYRVR